MYLKNIFGYFLVAFLFYFRPRNMNFHVQKMNFASTRNSGSPCLDLLSHFFIFPEFRISNVQPEIRTSGRNFERPVGISNFRSECRTLAGIWKVRPDFRTFGWNFKRPAGISNTIFCWSVVGSVFGAMWCQPGSKPTNQHASISIDQQPTNRPTKPQNKSQQEKLIPGGPRSITQICKTAMCE